MIRRLKAAAPPALICDHHDQSLLSGEARPEASAMAPAAGAVSIRVIALLLMN
jgi:hypothetical protein